MYEHAAAKVCVDGRRVRVEELVHDVDRGIRWFSVNWWDCGVFEALGELIYEGGRHGGGGGGVTN